MRPGNRPTIQTRMAYHLINFLINFLRKDLAARHTVKWIV